MSGQHWKAWLPEWQLHAASDEEIAQLRKMYTTYDSTEETKAHIDEYSETNIEFHQMIIKIGKIAIDNTDGKSVIFPYARDTREYD